MWLKLYTKFNLYQIVLLWLRSTRKNNCSGHWRILLTWKFHWDFTSQWQSPLLPQSTVGLVFGPISHTNIFKLCLMTTAQREMKPCNCQLYRFWENNILVFSFFGARNYIQLFPSQFNLKPMNPITNKLWARVPLPMSFSPSAFWPFFGFCDNKWESPM